MLTAIVLSLAACCGPEQAAAPTAPVVAALQRTVRCDELIEETRFPYVGRAPYRLRLVLGTASVPGPFLPQVSDTGPPRWRYFAKWGVVVRGGAGPALTITVPKEWRKRVGISWGNGGHGVFQHIRFPRCGTDVSRGNAYAGGFFLQAATDCVPLRYAVGGRSRTVWFGVGRRC